MYLRSIKSTDIGSRYNNEESAENERQDKSECFFFSPD